MSINAFRRGGFLQEVNRQFLHPLGLALEVTVDDETGEERLSGVWDYRNDPEGMLFGDDHLNAEFVLKATNVKVLADAKAEYRMKKFGWVIQPVEVKKDGK